MPISEQLQSANIVNQVNLQRLSTKEANSLLPFMREIIAYLEMRLAREGESIATKKRLNILLDDVERRLTRIYTQWDSEFFKDTLPQIAIEQAIFQGDSIEAVVKNYEPVIPTGNQIVASATRNPLVIGAKGSAVDFKSYTKNWKPQEVKRVVNAINGGFYSGRTVTEITRQVVGTKSGRYKDGILNVSRANIQGIVKNTINHMSVQAKEEFNRQNDDLIIGYEIVATLDSKTSAECFTGETTVTPVGSIEKLCRANYRGEIITLNLSTGEKLEGTPNHPVLTSDGWTRLDEIDPRKHVVYSAARDEIQVSGKQNVNMPTTFAELYDSVGEISGALVSSKRASSTDLYGDGEFIDGDIHILSAESNLTGRFKTGIAQPVEDELLAFVKNSRLLSCDCTINHGLVGRSVTIKPSEFTSGGLYGFVKAATRKLCFPEYFRRSFSLPEQKYSPLLCVNGCVINKASRSCLHKPKLFKESGHGCRGSVVADCNLPSRDSISIKPCNITSMSREFRSCHIYTLQSSLGYYTAGSIIVKNCQFQDGKQYFYKDGRNQPKPPFHHGGCRSTTSVILSPEYEFTRAGRTRPAVTEVDGKKKAERVDGNTTYFEWLKSQPKSLVIEALGRSKAEIFLNSGMSADEFKKAAYDRFGNPITVKQFAAKNKKAAKIVSEL